jgi:Uma2 family endonuclease
MSALPEQQMTEADYLAFERSSTIKHEFIVGEVYAMSGASEAHNLITGSAYAMLYNQLRGRACKIYPSDMKVRTPATGSYAYPDVTVVCGEAHFADDQRDVLLNPTVIIEVMSPTTERYDRGRKFQHYRELPSLQEYVLIAQDDSHIERFVRQEGGFWQFSEARGLESSLELSSIACTLTLAEVYEQVPLSYAVGEGDLGDEASSTNS